MLYDGDLHQHDRILTWLTSQDVFEIKNEIEEVNRKMLDKLLEENEFLAVYFCKYTPATHRALSRAHTFGQSGDINLMTPLRGYSQTKQIIRTAR